VIEKDRNPKKAWRLGRGYHEAVLSNRLFGQ